MFRSGTGVLSLTEESFDREVTEFSDLPVLVFFGAPWCEACLAMVPELAGVADRFEGRLRVVEVDVEADSSLRSRFGIRRIPALTLFVDGQVAEHEVGSNGLGVLLPVLEAGCPGSARTAIATRETRAHGSPPMVLTGSGRHDRPSQSSKSSGTKLNPEYDFVVQRAN